MKFIRFLFKTIFVVLIIALCIPVGYFALEENPKGLEGVKINADYKKGTMGGYIINLDRSPDRLMKIIPQAEKLGIPYERFSAVEGKLLSDDYLNDVVDFDRHYKLINHYPKKGTIGCSLSHIGVWQKFLESDYEYALVIEDDAVLKVEELATTLPELLRVSSMWDVISFSPSYSGTPLGVKSLAGGKNLSVYLTETATAAVYLINRKAAQAYLEKALPIIMSIDHMYVRSWEFGITYMGVENPRLAKQRGDISTIGQTKSAKADDKASTPILDRLHRGLFKLQTYVMISLTALKVYISNL